MSGRAVLGMGVMMVLGLVLLGPGVAEAGRRRTQMQYSGVVNLNEATPEELDRLPGVGRKAVDRILDHREKHPFKRVEELVRVKGFGKKKFQKLKPYLTLTGATTLQEEKRSASDAPAKPKH
ncbi:ComEA family DNA-binding protein [Hyalangium minutum]|uniref:Late competence protein ComEA, DNA receptor n=1 Tax=Hyalangium minutum TaxID=394096 RepID=A0A085WMK7_9BACT|nr:helix-hairpin-helix domain-containing protein [Hyalangium minutum]KFE68920.1 Late competence protein ComEA, DNA receptor [Hyalangium minutum]